MTVQILRSNLNRHYGLAHSDIPNDFEATSFADMATTLFSARLGGVIGVFLFAPNLRNPSQLVNSVVKFTTKGFEHVETIQPCHGCVVHISGFNFTVWEIAKRPRCYSWVGAVIRNTEASVFSLWVFFTTKQGARVKQLRSF